MLIEHLGIKILQLAQEHLIFLLDVVGIAWYHEEEQRVALDVTEESQTKSLSFARTLDDARDISHDKTLVVAVVHDAQRWFERSKWIVSNLRTSTGYGAEQRALAGIRESHQAHVGEELQLHDDGHLLHRFAWLGIARSLIGRGTELEVAQSATTALEQQYFLPIIGYIAYILARLGIIYHGATRHVDIDVLAIGAMALVASAITTMLGKEVALILEVQQSPVVVVAAQIDASSTSAIAAVRTTIRLVLYVAQVHGAFTTLTRAAVDLYIVYEIGFSH